MGNPSCYVLTSEERVLITIVKATEVWKMFVTLHIVKVYSML